MPEAAVAPAQRETWLAACEMAEWRAAGFKLREIGAYRGVSHQRVSQLVPHGAALLIRFAESVRTVRDA